MTPCFGLGWGFWWIMPLIMVGMMVLCFFMMRRRMGSMMCCHGKHKTGSEKDSPGPTPGKNTIV